MKQGIANCARSEFWRRCEFLPALPAPTRVRATSMPAWRRCDEGLAMTDRGERFNMPEFYRVESRTLLAGFANDRKAAEAAYRGAIEVGAISTPSCSIARGPRLGAAPRRDRPTSVARELLATIYGGCFPRASIPLTQGGEGMLDEGLIALCS